MTGQSLCTIHSRRRVQTFSSGSAHLRPLKLIGQHRSPTALAAQGAQLPLQQLVRGLRRAQVVVARPSPSSQLKKAGRRSCAGAAFSTIGEDVMHCATP